MAGGSTRCARGQRHASRGKYTSADRRAGDVPAAESLDMPPDYLVTWVEYIEDVR